MYERTRAHVYCLLLLFTDLDPDVTVVTWHGFEQQVEEERLFGGCEQVWTQQFPVQSLVETVWERITKNKEKIPYSLKHMLPVKASTVFSPARAPM